MKTHRKKKKKQKQKVLYTWLVALLHDTPRHPLPWQWLSKKMQATIWRQLMKLCEKQFPNTICSLLTCLLVGLLETCPYCVAQAGLNLHLLVVIMAFNSDLLSQSPSRQLQGCVTTPKNTMDFIVVTLIYNNYRNYRNRSAAAKGKINTAGWRYSSVVQQVKPCHSFSLPPLLPPSSKEGDNVLRRLEGR